MDGAVAAQTDPARPAAIIRRNDSSNPQSAGVASAWRLGYCKSYSCDEIAP
jgi:hypothetical protein